MNKYKLIKEYPGHKIGDLAYFEPDISDTHFLWEGITGPIEKLKIPRDFQPDATSDWFEEIIPQNYQILIFRSTNNYIFGVDNIRYKLNNNNNFDIFIRPHSSINNINSAININLESLLYDENFISVKNKKLEIFCVKRLSDKHIFTIGDKFQNIVKGENSTIDTIKSFHINDNNLSVKGEKLFCNINLEKVLPFIPKLVLKTEDNVDIYENDNCFFVKPREPYAYPFNNVGSRKDDIENIIKDDSKHYKYFSTNKAARQYIINNHKLISIDDIEDVFCDIISNNSVATSSVIKARISGLRSIAEKGILSNGRKIE